MRHGLASVSLLALLVPATSPIRASGDAPPAGIQATYDEMRAGFETKSIERLMATTTSDFRARMPEGERDGAAVAGDLKDLFAGVIGKLKVKVKLIDCKLKGDTAIVSSAMTMSFRTKASDGKVHNFETKSHATDTLVKTRKGWKFKRIEVGQGQYKMDGKVVDPSALSPPAIKP